MSLEKPLRKTLVNKPILKEIVLVLHENINEGTMTYFNLI